MFLPGVCQQSLNHCVSSIIKLKKASIQIWSETKNLRHSGCSTAFRQHIDDWTLSEAGWVFWGFFCLQHAFQEDEAALRGRSQLEGKDTCGRLSQRWKATNSAEIFGKGSRFLPNTQANVYSNLTCQFCSSQESQSVRAGLQWKTGGKGRNCVSGEPVQLCSVKKRKAQNVVLCCTVSQSSYCSCVNNMDPDVSWTDRGLLW